MTNRLVARPTPLRVRGAAISMFVASIGWAAALLWNGGALLQDSNFFDETRYSFVRWEVTTFPNRWIYLLGEPLRDDPTDDEALVRYFAAARETAQLERETGDKAAPVLTAALSRAREERRRFENHAEAAIERRLTAVLKREGLLTGLLIPVDDIVWPPVDFELAAAPRVLAESPRDRIALLSSNLLSNALTAEEVYALEAKATSAHRVAVVLSTGGVATYPSLVNQSAEYRRVVETAAHEWLHQYLAFHPLGRRYAHASLRDVNETVASIGGEGLAALVIERYPLPSPPSANAAQGRAIDLPAVLRELRFEVDALLAEGRIAEAESRMEEVRRDLERRAVAIRKINQAYFAFRGLYATSGASAGDLGPRLQELRQRSGSVGAIIRAVRGLSSRNDLDTLLAERLP